MGVGRLRPFLCALRVSALKPLACSIPHPHGILSPAPMAKSPAPPPCDVLVLGEHPAAYLTAALLRQGGKLHVLHSCLPDERVPDRLVLVNPEMFDLHALLGPLRRKLDTTSIYGLHFLSDDPATRSQYQS